MMSKMRCSLGLLALILVGGALADDNACSTCKWAARIFEDALCDVEANEFAVDFIQKNVCTVAPDRQQCEQLAEMLVPVAIEWLRNSATPSQLCSTAGVCGTSMLAEPTNMLHASRMRRGAVRDSVGCSMCTYVMRTLKEELDDPLALQDMKQQALQVCERLPADIEPTCTDLINTYGDMLVQMIESLDPAASCQAVGLCVPPQLRDARLPPLTPELVAALSTLQKVSSAAQQSTTQPRLAGSNSLGGNMCDMCKLTVLEVHTLISNPQIQQQATDYAKVMCDSLGASMSDTCKSYVDTYAPALFTVLEQYLVQVDQLCQSFGMCDKPAALVAHTAVIRTTTDDASATAVTDPEQLMAASLEVMKESLQRAGAAGIVAGLAAAKQLLPDAVLEVDSARPQEGAMQEQGEGDGEGENGQGRKNASAMNELLGALLMPRVQQVHVQGASADAARGVQGKGASTTVHVVTVGRERDGKTARKLVA